MLNKFRFECPVCNCERYNPNTFAGRREDSKSPSYVCACCGFSFVDPARYKQRLEPYSTIRTRNHGM